MEGTSVEAVRKTVRTYIIVFVSLMVLTLITVAVSVLHLSIGMAIAVALFIALIKGTLVAGYFMHLMSEKKLIYSTLILTVIFFMALMFLPISHALDNLTR
ncbi:MAG: cytochrome C oxidase subunit IV family protein [Ignavibacteria bacterium]|nr:cytochrome C oxidase subunit IV family protein [Ignavibacteria bacterium]